MKITCAQHIFANVPADRSPNGKRGYQTLFFSKELNQEMVRAIEDRALFVGDESSPSKWQYYALSKKHHAFSRTHALAERDEFGRKGRYLTHTLILDGNSFRRLSYMPFDILQQAPWLQTLDEVYAQGDMRSGRIGILSFEIIPGWHTQIERIASLWKRERIQLVRLVQRITNPTSQLSPIHILGNETEVLSTLMLLFLYAAPSQRWRLNFDSYAEGCDWERDGRFVLLGYPSMPRHTQIIIDASSRHIQGLSVDDGIVNAYENWLLKDGINLPTTSLIAQQSQADILNYALSASGVSPSLLASVPEAFQKRFVWLNQEQLYANWLSLFPTGLSRTLRARIRASLAADWWKTATIWFEGVQAQDISEFLFRICLDIQTVPEKSDQKVLSKWIKEQQHPLLHTFPPFWAKQVKKWRTTLEALNEEEYEYLLCHLVQWPETPIPLQEALITPVKSSGWRRNKPEEWNKQSAGKFHIWLHCVAPKLTPKAWKQALESMNALPDTALHSLADIVHELPAPSKQYLQKWVKSNNRQLPALTDVLINGSEQKRSRFNRFFKRG